jgi:hypothetical protein
MEKITLSNCSEECIYVDTYYKEGNKNERKYDYVCSENNSLILNVDKKLVTINPFSHNPFILQSFYTGGRLGNYLFALSHLCIVQKNYIKNFHIDVDIYTNWNCTYIDDWQSGTNNITNFNVPKKLEEFTNIKCNHFSNTDYFCEKYVKDFFYGELIDSRNNINYGYYNIYKEKSSISSKYAVLFEINLAIPDVDYFNIQNMELKNMSIDDLKIILEKSPKFVSILSWDIDNYRDSIYYNYKLIENEKDTLKKCLFSNCDNYVSNIKNNIFFQEKDCVYICMHLRAGDYLVGKNISFYIPYYSYYVECLENIISENPSKKLKVVFCFHKNDMNLGKLYQMKILETLNNPNIEIIFENDPRLSQIFNAMNGSNDHLYFMSSFEYYIMGNSTYAFWSAYLSNGKVYYPNLYQTMNYESIAIIKEQTSISNIKNLDISNYKEPNKYYNPRTKPFIKSLHYPKLFSDKEQYVEIKINKILSPLYYILTNIEENDLKLTILLLYIINYANMFNWHEGNVHYSRIEYYIFDDILEKLRKNPDLMEKIRKLFPSGKIDQDELQELHNYFLSLKKEFDNTPFNDILLQKRELSFLEIIYEDKTKQAGGYYNYKYLKYNNKIKSYSSLSKSL